MSLIATLNAFRDMTPDQIVDKLNPQVFIKGQFEPWVCPEALRGRMVLIEQDERWWRGDGNGVTRNREGGVSWPIDVAFNRFRSEYSPRGTRLHLLP